MKPKSEPNPKSDPHRKDAPIRWDKESRDRIYHQDEDHPEKILGLHRLNANTQIVRAFLPRAVKAWIHSPDLRPETMSLKRVDERGFYELALENLSDGFRYRIGFEDASGYSEEREDPYVFPSLMTDFDMYLVAQGTHYDSYRKFGAHKQTRDGIAGVEFTVWAPHAKAVSVAANFNHWHENANPMMRLNDAGLWSLFIPGLKEGEYYKFAIKPWSSGHALLKSDPYAFQAELRPGTASVVADLDRYVWKDSDWMRERAGKDWLQSPMAIYEVHLGSWKRDGQRNWGFLTYRELAHELVDYVKSRGFTHIELMPISEHPLDISWGYQVTGYYAPTSRFGTPEDFMYFVDRCHENGIGVILDWVPSHFPKDSHGLNEFDGQQLYAYKNWKRGEHKEWGTLVFDYGRNEVRNFLVSNALFWLDRYHIDGLRVDAVASMLYLDYSRKEGEWEPNVHGGNENLEAVDFIKKFNEIVHARFPGILTIAEESTAWTGVSRPTYLGGLGFSMKWNMGWMHDMLEYFKKEPIHRKYHQNMITFSLLYAFTENFILPISHDEVVHGKGALLSKMPGDDWQKFANTRLFLGYMYGHPGKKLLFMGSDIGQRDEWNCDTSVDWHLVQFDPHRQLNLYMGDLNRVYRETPALYEIDFNHTGFEWIDFHDADSSIMSFIRWSKDWKDLVLVVCNMTPVPREGYRVGVPKPGFYREILNSDAVEYGGGGIGNSGGMTADAQGCHNRSHSLCLNLPPLGINYFRWEG